MTTKYIPNDPDVAEWAKTTLHKGQYDSEGKASKAVGPKKKWSDAQKAEARAAIAHYFQTDKSKAEPKPKKASKKVVKAQEQAKAAPAEEKKVTDTMIPSQKTPTNEQVVGWKEEVGKRLEAAKNGEGGLAGRVAEGISVRRNLTLSEIIGVATSSNLSKEVTDLYQQILVSLGKSELELLKRAPGPKQPQGG